MNNCNCSLKFGIIILNWNNYTDTKKLIDSILLDANNISINIEIYLIDNDSQDGSGIKLKEEFSQVVKFYNTGSNKGYTGGNNFGILKALEDECDYILILNNDLEIVKFSSILKTIDDVFQFDADIGIVGFNVFDKKTKQPLKNAGKINDMFTKLLNIDTTPISLSETTNISFQKAVCGCAICFKATCIDKIGIFDENFFMYAEEQDICLRAIKHNWKVVKVDSLDFKIYRNIDPISDNQLIWYYGTRNIFCAYKKNLSFSIKNLFYTLQVAIFIKQIIYFFINSKPVISYKILKGLKDAFAGKNCHKDKK